jgi:hypothetical protein
VITITVARRHLTHGSTRSAFRHPVALAIREAIPQARLVTVGAARVSWITREGLRLTGHVVAALPPEAREPRGPVTFDLGGRA